jgi:hypothetical protein
MEAQNIVALSVISGVLTLFFILGFVYKSVRNKLDSYINEKFDKNEIVVATTRAQFFGEESKGSKQIRGNGAIVLTKDQMIKNMIEKNTQQIVVNGQPFSSIKIAAAKHGISYGKIIRRLQIARKKMI